MARRQSLILSLVAVLLCMAAGALAGRLQRQAGEFPFAGLSGASLEEAEAAYAASGEAEDLITLLKILCCRAELEGDAAAEEQLARYGNQLFSLAKSEAIDLQALGEQDDTLLELLRILRSHGAS